MYGCARVNILPTDISPSALCSLSYALRHTNSALPFSPGVEDGSGAM